MPEAAAFLQPCFSHPRVRAMMSRRGGGVSRPPYDSLNLGLHVGDRVDDVIENRRRWTQAFGMPLVRLTQVHGSEVLTLDRVRDDAPRADASATSVAGIGCEVLVADCLPVLLAHRGGQAVAAAHAGWRGLAGGVLEAAVTRCCELAGAPPGEIEAWLGPCIGPAAFEVGAEVLVAFSRDPSSVRTPGFVPRAGQPGKWLADLPGLARERLAAAGLARISGNDGSAPWCTVQQASVHFSFRRDRVTGRLAAAVGLLDGERPGLFLL